jgi:hypothetical protein
MLPVDTEVESVIEETTTVFPGEVVTARVPVEVDA